eukprot:maker-scaffold867_size86973-snap-gene-0.13 protein:Tk12140 transcript:maker-scaffold867_size86973-snap-gene-0.13-mRNA-1 annotation:"n-terminal asparagine amidase"
MVLIYNGSSINHIENLRSFYQTHSDLLLQARKFATSQKKFVKPEGVLYVRQKEYATTFHGDRFQDGTKVAWCGTEDVLTCHVLVLHHHLTQVTAIAHFDEYVRELRLSHFVVEFLERVRDQYFVSSDANEDFSEDYEWEEWEDEENLDGQDDSYSLRNFDFEEPIQLHLIGGYADEAGKAQKLTMRLLRFFMNFTLGDRPMEFDLGTFCVGEPNSKRGHYCHNEPIVGGVVVDVANGQPHPAIFNRTFVSSNVDEDLQTTLLLGPSLIPKPSKLKKMILQREDQGFASRSTA